MPGPPAFVPDLMGSAAHELDDVRQAADRVLSRAVFDLMAASADSLASGAPRSRDESVQLVVVGPGQPGEFEAKGRVSFSSFGRDVAVPALVEGQHCDRELPTPLMVARYLASRDIASHPEHVDLWASARWFTTTGADATALGMQLRADGTRVALILVADGAACHGPKAPRAQDERAQEYDDAVCASLASGEPGRLAQLSPDLGDELGATGPQVWPVLLAAAGSDGFGTGPTLQTRPWVGAVFWTGAPYGVGWTVASWRRPASTTG